MHTTSQEQSHIIGHRDGAMLVMAGPGSGKTATACSRFVALMREGVDPARIFCLTFTRSAAHEMIGRIAQAAKIDHSILWSQVCTYHALGLRILRAEQAAGTLPYKIDPNEPIVREGQHRRLVENVLRPGIDYAAARKYIALAKRRFVTPAEAATAATTYRDRTLAAIYADYEAQLARQPVRGQRGEFVHGLDYDSLIFEAYRLLAGNPAILAKYQERCEHLQVDEFQDTSPAEQRFSALMGAKAKSFLAVGDFNQSIFSFAGADCSVMLNFANWFPGHQVAYLSQNWRSTRNIIETFKRAVPATSGEAGEFLGRITTGRGPGAAVRALSAATAEEEAREIFEDIEMASPGDPRYSDFAVLARTNRQLRAFEDECVRRNIPYRSPGCGFYGRSEIKLAVAFLRMMEDPNATECVRIEGRKARQAAPQESDGWREQWVAQRVARSGLECVRCLTPQVISAIERAAEVRAGEGKDPLPFDEMPHFSDPRQSVQRAVSNFHHLIDGLRQESQGLSVRAQLEMVYARTGFLEWLGRNEDIDEGDNSRAANARELLAAAARFDSLEAFLDFIDQTEEAPRRHGGAARRMNAVTLSTIHRAKGQEWNAVFVAGLTEGLLPHQDGEPDEEARLLYVALSRAKNQLTISGYGQIAPFLVREMAAVTT